MSSRPRLGTAIAVPLCFAAASWLGCATGVPSVDDRPSRPPEVVTVRFYDKLATPVGGDLEASSLAFVRAADQLTGLGDDWRVRRIEDGPDGQRHVRLQQLHGGLRVVGGDVVVHSDAARFSMVNGTVVRDLAGVDPVPGISADAALEVARAHYARAAKDADAPLVYARDASELVVYARSGRDARTAWHVSFFTELQAGINPGLWSYYVDAKTGDLLHHVNQIADAVFQASGPGGNARFPHPWTNALDVVPWQGDQYVAKTPRQMTISMNNATEGAGFLVGGGLADFGDAAQNDAHGHVEETLDMMRDWYGLDSFDGHGAVVFSRVHYGAEFENAFFDGQQLTFGDGGATLFPLSGALDVVAHELHHGFTMYHSNLAYEGESGGLNESFSDIAGTLAEFYVKGAAADFDIGRELFRVEGALRFMCNPTADGVSIDHYSAYAGQDPHLTSGIPNKAFCRAARRLASGSPDGAATTAGVRRAGEAFVLANARYWTTYTDFRTGCQGTLDAATELGFSDAERAALRQSWVDVGVHCDGEVAPVKCDETFTADTGTLTSPSFPAAYPDNYFHTWCIQPASGLPATLTFDSFDLEDKYDLLQTEDAAGRFFTTTGTAAPPPVTSSLLVIRFLTDGSLAGAGWRVTWQAGAVPNLAPVATITSPADGANLTGSVVIAAKGTDADGVVAKVRFELPDGTAVEDTAAPFEITWDLATLAAGAGYAIRVIAYDDLGAASAPAQIGVVVDNGVDCPSGTRTATGLPLAIPDHNATGVTSTITVAGAGRVGAMTVSAHVTHPWRDDLKVTLTAPDGTEVVLTDRVGGSADDLVLSDVDLATLAGAKLGGAWRLRVSDLAGSDTGTLDSWSIAFTGDCVPVPEGWSGAATPNLATVNLGTACTTLTIAGATGDALAAKIDLSGWHDFVPILSATIAHNGFTAPVFGPKTLLYHSHQQAFSLTDVAVSGIAGSPNGDWTLCINDGDAYEDKGIVATWSVHD